MRLKAILVPRSISTLCSGLEIQIFTKICRIRSSLTRWISSLREHFKADNFSLDRLFKCLIIFLVGSYRTLGSSWLGGGCRFEPSCSEYCQEAFRKHSFKRATFLTIKRLISCRPGGRFGYDPVPAAEYRPFHQYSSEFNLVHLKICSCEPKAAHKGITHERAK